MLPLGFVIQCCALGARGITTSITDVPIDNLMLKVLCVVFKLIVQLAVLLSVRVVTTSDAFDEVIANIDITSGTGMLLGEHFARQLIS